MKKIKIFLTIILCLATLCSCKSSFPKENLPKLAQEKIKKEAKYDTEVFLQGTSLYIVANFPGTIPLSLAVSKETFDIIQNIILASTNVALSTDAKIEFFVIVILDPTNKIQLQFKQNIIDIKKWFYGLIGREDFFQRSLTEIKFWDPNSGNNFVEIKIPDFIMDQTLYILKNNIISEIKIIEKNLEKQMKIRKNSIKNNGFISEENSNEINKLISELQYSKIVEIYIASILNRNYKKIDSPSSVINKKITRNVFEYNFKKFSESDLLQINYEKFGQDLAKINLAVCEKYEFINIDEIIVKENQQTVFSYIVNPIK